MKDGSRKLGDPNKEKGSVWAWNQKTTWYKLGKTELWHKRWATEKTSFNQTPNLSVRNEIGIN